MAESWDPTTRATVQKIPLLTVKAGPRDKDGWEKRLKEVWWPVLLLVPSSGRRDLAAAPLPVFDVQRWCIRCQLPCQAVSFAPFPPRNHGPQELQALIKYIEINKSTDMDW